MRRALLWLLPCLLAGLPAEAASTSSDAERALKAMLERVLPRRGIQVRSLVIVPLVSRQVPPKAPERLRVEDLTWEPHAGDTERDVTFLEKEPSDPKAKKAPAVLPTGLRLQRDGGERLLSRPALVPAAVPTVLAAPTLPGSAKESAAGAFGPLATPAQRRFLFQGQDRKTLGKLVAFEAGVAGLDPMKKGLTLAEIAAAPEVAKAVKAVEPRVTKIAGAYGGESLGHVAFIGNRPVEVVLAASPAVYADTVKRAAQGLALSLVLWERWYGKVDEEPAEMSWPAFTTVAEKILASLRAGNARKHKEPRRKLAGESNAAGSLWRVRGRTLRGGTKAVQYAWLLLDEASNGVLLEAWPEPQAAPLPSPAKEPGGPGQDEDPYNRKGGSQTLEFLERLVERLKQRGGR